jgi:hypothetical protein
MTVRVIRHLRLMLICCALLLLLPVTAIRSSHVASASGAVAKKLDGTAQEQLRLELGAQRFISDHTDGSGFVRPDLWRIGMEHARQMRTVRNIGAVPVASRH